MKRSSKRNYSEDESNSINDKILNWTMDTSKEIIFANKIYGKTLLKKHPILTEMLCFVWLNLLFVSVCGEIANCSVMAILFVERVAVVEKVDR